METENKKLHNQEHIIHHTVHVLYNSYMTECGIMLTDLFQPTDKAITCTKCLEAIGEQEDDSKKKR